MLPFLKKAKDGGASSPVETVMREPDEDKEEDFDSLDVAAQEIIDAVHSKDRGGLSAALKAFFEMCDSEPHHEGEHE